MALATALSRNWVFEVAATRSTADGDPASWNYAVKTVFKVNEKDVRMPSICSRPVLLIWRDHLHRHQRGPMRSATKKAIRKNAVSYRVPCITTMSGARAAVEAVVSRRRDPVRVWSLQEIHGTAAAAAP